MRFCPDSYEAHVFSMKSVCALLNSRVLTEKMSEVQEANDAKDADRVQLIDTFCTLGRRSSSSIPSVHPEHASGGNEYGYRRMSGMTVRLQWEGTFLGIQKPVIFYRMMIMRTRFRFLLFFCISTLKFTIFCCCL